MPDYTFDALSAADLTISGPDPFASDASRNTDTYNATTFTMAPGASWTDLTVADDDTALEDGDTGQQLATATDFNGVTWPVGTDIEIEYSYLVRPVGSTDPADYITVYVLEFDGDVQGITSDRRLSENTTYEIISGGDDDPVTQYSQLVVCFTPGIAIATPRGPVAVEDLRVGDAVVTADNGAQPIAWIGRQRARGVRAGTPVSVAPGVLRNERPLVLSQQHRVLMHDAMRTPLLVPVKALVGRLPGVTLTPQWRVTYFHLLFERHEVIFANGAAVESMYPGPVALASLAPRDRATLEALFPGIGQHDWTPARQLVRPGQWARRPGRAAMVPVSARRA